MIQSSEMSWRSPDTVTGNSDAKHISTSYIEIEFDPTIDESEIYPLNIGLLEED